MKKHLDVPEKDRKWGEVTLLIGLGSIVTIGVIAFLSSYGYITVSIPH